MLTTTVKANVCIATPRIVTPSSGIEVVAYFLVVVHDSGASLDICTFPLISTGIPSPGGS